MDNHSLIRWAKKLNLNPSSPTTQQLYANRYLTVAEYIARFRKARILRVVPSEALDMSVEEVMQKKMVGGRNVRKLLESTRQKFRK